MMETAMAVDRDEQDPRSGDGAASAPVAAARRARGRRNLVLLFVLCLLPVVASYLAYYVMPPAGRTNRGTLLDPQVDLPAGLALRDLEGRPFDLASLRGRWIMLVVDGGACGEHCAEKLYMVRQQRMMTNRDRERIERVWLVDDAAAVPSAVLEAYEGMHILRASRADLSAFLPLAPGADLADHIWLVDPLGHVMMRYPQKPAVDDMKNDMIRLLKASRVG